MNNADMESAMLLSQGSQLNPTTLVPKLGKPNERIPSRHITTVDVTKELITENASDDMHLSNDNFNKDVNVAEL